MDKLDEMERHCIEQIEVLQREYMKAAEPYVRQLGQIRDCRPRTYTLPSGELMIPILPPSATTDNTGADIP